MSSYSVEGARRFLSEHERIFSNPKIQYFYCEWILLIRVREKQFLLADIHELVHHYPNVYKAFLAIQGSINLPNEKLYPESLQNWINATFRLCLDVLFNENKSNVDALLNYINSGGHYEECVPSYYKLCVEAYKKVSEVCRKYPLGSKEINQIVKYASYLTARGGQSDSDYLAKILKLNTDRLSEHAIKILHLAKKKEGKQLEFKSSFEYDVTSNSKNKNLKYECTKTIAAFLNSQGGTLLVGVNDSGKILGMQKDLSYVDNNHDDFVLKFKDTVLGRLGKGICNLVEWSLVDVGTDLFVLMVDVKPSPFPVWDNRCFFIRNNPSSDRLLNAREYKEYVKTRFLEEFVSEYIGK
ncbi:AlbA family DNA-binding domain-containing protein [Shewanella mangrovisoli]|uniref:AlbA family DNA-binding domain-containing protein n=1 Tax=Shewanella mangrovisoli TaxID=2864211 RepID=UPI001C65A639|nr:ATP-binding protein [Shewanella mangrovisoli]QYK09303.1 ATP-binding protein [Shewanella mangrovisoli]